MESDSQLLIAFVENRDEAAFRALVERHADWCYGVACRLLGQRSFLAEEVCQTVFTRLAQNASNLTGRETVGGWLYVSIKYVAMNQLRSETRRKRNEEAYVMENENDASSVDWQEASPVLQEVLGELKDDDRDAVCLRYFEGLSFREIGSRLGVKENAARMRLNRAVGKLQSLLANRGIKSSASVLGVGLGIQVATASPAGFAASLASGALAASAGGTTVSALGAILLFMKTKTITVSAVVAALLASGVAIHEWRDSQTVDARLELIVHENVALEERIQKLETELREERSLVFQQEAPSPAPVKEAVVVAREPLKASVPPLTREYVLGEYKRARALIEQGNAREGAAILMKVLDSDIGEVAGLRGFQQPVIALLGEVAKSNDEVWEGLAERRDALEESALASGKTSDYNEMRDWHLMNRSLEDTDHSLAVFDHTEDPRTKALMKRVVLDSLVEAGRYEDAVSPGMGAQESSKYRQILQPVLEGSSGQGESSESTQRMREMARESMGRTLEALAGAGRNEEALDLIEDVLNIDETPETLDVIGKHLQRADSVWLLDHLGGSERP